MPHKRNLRKKIFNVPNFKSKFLRHEQLRKIPGKYSTLSYEDRTNKGYACLKPLLLRGSKLKLELQRCLFLQNKLTYTGFTMRVVEKPVLRPKGIIFYIILFMPFGSKKVSKNLLTFMPFGTSFYTLFQFYDAILDRVFHLSRK